MGYLSFQIIFFLLLAAVLGFVIGWLLRGSRFQSELQDLDGRWRTKLGEVEGERDRFVTDLTHANEAKAKADDAKVKAESDFKRLSETHESALQALKRDHRTELAALTDAEKSTAGLTSDLAARNDELSKARAELAKAQQSGGDAGRLGKELAAASERAATLESSLRDSKTAQANCRREVDRLQTEIAELKRNAGTGGAGTASSGGALGLMSSGGDTVARGGAGGTGGSAGGTGQAGDARSGAGASTGGTGGGASGSGYASGSSAGTGGAGGSGGSAGGAGQTGSSSAGSGGHAGGGSGSSSGGAGYDRRAASPSYLADAGGQGFGGREAPSTGRSSSSSSGAGTGEEEGVRPAALGAARDGRADDLKRISGVGPKLEKTLNGLGIYHFSQIAEFTPDNVAWVDRHLRFKGRIERENWIEQAKVLATGGETEFSRRQ